MSQGPDEQLTRAKCRGCNYPLRGLAEHRCPECGRPFDPADPRTMNVGRDLNRFVRAALRPTGKLFIAWEAGAGAILLAAVSAPSVYSLPFVIAVPACVLLALYWGLRIAVALLIVFGWRQQKQVSARAVRQWLLPPALAIVLLGLAICRVPLYCAFWISRPPMERLAAETINMPNTAYSRPDRQVGVFRATRIEKYRRGMHFAVQGAGFSGDAGFAYFPSSRPADTWDRKFEHFVGNWYVWWDDF